jgi:uroporphyrinogen decarboxylase
MTSQERILSTLNRQSVDRPPVDLWCVPEVLDTLRSYTSLQDEFEVYRALGIDKIAWVFPGYDGRFAGPDDGDGTNPWGVPTRKVRAGLATYQEYINPPLAGYADLRHLADYPSWPNPDLFDYNGARALAERARSYDFATIGPWISHFEIYCQMRGLENALMDILTEPDFLEAALDKIDAIQTAMLERMLQSLGDSLDIIFISDDMGTQESLLVSLGAWERHFRGRLKRWCDLIHQYGKKVLYHTDGAVAPLIPGLIGCGIDILNPIQHVCAGMDRLKLKNAHGQDLVFHGGVENQEILPRGSVSDVVNETRTCMETLGQGGGYICCSCHNVQAGTPVENILAMIKTVRNWGG